MKRERYTRHGVEEDSPGGYHTSRSQERNRERDGVQTAGDLFNRILMETQAPPTERERVLVMRRGFQTLEFL